MKNTLLGAFLLLFSVNVFADYPACYPEPEWGPITQLPCHVAINEHELMGGAEFALTQNRKYIIVENYKAAPFTLKTTVTYYPKDRHGNIRPQRIQKNIRIEPGHDYYFDFQNIIENTPIIQGHTNRVFFRIDNALTFDGEIYLIFTQFNRQNEMVEIKF